MSLKYEDCDFRRDESFVFDFTVPVQTTTKQKRLLTHPPFLPDTGTAAFACVAGSVRISFAGYCDFVPVRGNAK
jgi:hypothetical protein